MQQFSKIEQQNFRLSNEQIVAIYTRKWSIIRGLGSISVHSNYIWIYFFLMVLICLKSGFLIQDQDSICIGYL
jgi:hypothetical protein